ncbi:DUF4168 domain-containing protein [Crocosphaera chwakensis]|uniref:DUF4168 domain-containing protein n=1 Tax=Crocosphaera chwakensis CCY0110 TaxID=391612 RepID=A3ISN4_9CHRO|nr:hypothetical protein [Crocosphaera chwakensis]EAZ90454.1 hypothetical protein CY0110_26542 [Crocosphaera chwakensis CCY0110]
MFKSLVVGGAIAIVGLIIPTSAYGQFNGGSISPTIEAETVANPQVSPLELQQFVQVIKRFQRIERYMQMQMAKAIKKEGLTPEKFMEINESQRQLRSESVNSSEDLEKFRKVVVQFREIMDDAEEKRQSTVENQGLELDRFLEIEKIVAGNKQLQSKVEQMLGN